MPIDSPYLVKPGKKFQLSKRETNDTGPFESKEAAVEPTQENLRKIDELQELLYADARHALLIVFQALVVETADGIRSAAKHLDPEARRVLSLRFQGLTQSEIAEQIGCSQMHISRVIKRNVKELFRHIEADAPLPATDETPDRRASPEGSR